MEASNSRGADNFIRWSPGDIKCLINIYEANIIRLETYAKKKVWEEIANEMRNMRGKMFTGEQCNGKWKGLKTMYKKIKDHNRTSGNNRKSWEHFDALDSILSKHPEVNPPATCSRDDSSVVLNPGGSEKDYDFDDLIIEETAISNPSLLTSKSRRRKADDTETARAERHRDKMARTDKFLNLFETLVKTITRD